MRIPKTTALPVLAILAALAGGCGSSSKSSSTPATSSNTPAKAVPATFVGKVSGTNAYIGMVANSSPKLAVYICDGAGNKIGDFFHGSIPHGSSHTTLKTTDSSDTLTINVSQSQLQKLVATGGTVTGTWNQAGGARHSFTAQAAHPPAALWAEDETVNGTARHGKWIVLNDGSVRGSIDLDYARQKVARDMKATQGQSTGPGGTDVKMAVMGSAPPPSLAYQTDDTVVRELPKQAAEKTTLAVKAAKSAPPKTVFYVKRVNPVSPGG